MKLRSVIVAAGAAVYAWWARHPMLQPLAAAALVLAVQRTTHAGEVRFAELRPGERVVVQYRADGCFNSIRARITFVGTKTGIRYVASVHDPAAYSTSGDLTRGDAARLDVAMREYRALAPHGWCTGASHVRVTRRPFGIPVRESYSTHSCSRDPRGLEFWELLRPLDRRQTASR